MARVMLLGRLADAAGWRERTIHADTVAALKSELARDAPALSGALADDRVVVIVNDVVTRGDHAIRPDDAVGFMPPMSGG